MELHYYLPRADLSEYIRCYYYFASDRAASQPLPAELGNIRVVIEGGGVLHPPGGTPMVLASEFLLGPTSGCYVIDTLPGTRVFGVGILPRGWGALLGVSAAEVADEVVDLTAFTGKASARAMTAIRAAPDLPQMAAIADRYLADLLARQARQACAYPTALEQWILHPSDLDLDQLLQMMDVSRRQTDRLAKQYFGASPKLLQRKYRVLRAAARMRAADCWRTAAGAAFYDQSHFIKEFKTFIGVTPLEYLNNQASLAAAVQDRRSRAVARHPLANL